MTTTIGEGDLRKSSSRQLKVRQDSDKGEVVEQDDGDDGGGRESPVTQEIRRTSM